MLTRLRHLFIQAKTHQGFQRYFANTSWMFAEQILRIFSGLFVGIYVARYLGPVQYGIYSYAAAFVALFGAVARLGLDGIVVRDLVNHPQNRDVYLGTAFWLKLIGAFLTLCFLAIAVQFTDNNVTTNLYIFIIASGLIFQAFDVVDFHFQSKVLSKYVSISKLIQLALSSILKLYFIFTHADLLWFVLVSLVDQVTLALTLVIAYWRQKMGIFFGHFSLGTAKTMLRNSWPLMLSGIAITLYMRIDQIMIKEMLGEREVGLYSAAVRLSEAWYFVPVIITTSLFPSIVNAKKISESLYHQRLQRLYTLTVWLAISVAIPLTFMGDWIATLLYGNSYKESGTILSIHIWTGIFVGIAVVKGRWQMTENMMAHHFYGAVIGASCNVALNMIAIPRYGGIGAALATLVSQMVVSYGVNFLFPQLKPQNKFIKNAFLGRIR